MRRDHPIRRDRGWITPDYSLRLVKRIIIFSLSLSFFQIFKLSREDVETITRCKYRGDNSKHDEYLHDG